MTAQFRCKPIPLLVITLTSMAALLYRYCDVFVGTPAMREEFVTGTDILEFFVVPERDAIEVTWAHAVNSERLLDAAIKGGAMMLEADVRLRAEDGAPVMAHDASDIASGVITLDEWLAKVKKSKNKGIKLDFKSARALGSSLPVLRNLQHFLRLPVWINSDILVGPNSAEKPVNATEFFHEVQDIFPHSTLSVGWTTSYNHMGNNQGYTQKMVEEMYTFCAELTQAVTFPVRASLTAQSLQQLKWLVKKSARFSLTVWHSGTEEVAIEDLVRIRESFEHHCVYYDLPEELMSLFLAKL